MTQDNSEENNVEIPQGEGLLQPTLRQARKLVVAVFGGTIVLIGVITLVTPGPAFVIIPLGLAILATEFLWARRLLKRIKSEADGAWSYLKGTPEKGND